MMDDFQVDDDLTLGALQDLVEMSHPDLQQTLADQLEHYDPEIRVFSALTLAELFQDIRAIPVLAEAMESGSHRLRRAAADMLWEIGDSNPAGLIRALHFERGTVRDAIAAALEMAGWFPDDVETEIAYCIATWDWRAIIMIGSPAVPGLLSVLSDPDGNVRRGAVWALGQIGDERAVPWLIGALDDTSGGLLGLDERVCDIAAESLVRIGTPEALDAVEAWRAARFED